MIGSRTDDDAILPDADWAARFLWGVIAIHIAEGLPKCPNNSQCGKYLFLVNVSA